VFPGTKMAEMAGDTAGKEGKFPHLCMDLRMGQQSCGWRLMHRAPRVSRQPNDREALMQEQNANYRQDKWNVSHCIKYRRITM